MSIIVTDKKRLIAFIAVAILVTAGAGFFLWKTFTRPDTGNPNDYLTLNEAANLGEKATYKLMIQIETPKGNPEDLKGRYQRGDIVLIKPVDWQLSDAEKNGFLIVKMDLTEKQTELLTMSLDEIKRERNEAGRPERETLERRKYTVNLEKLGIAPDNERGQEITDKAFRWEEVASEKEMK